MKISLAYCSDLWIHHHPFYLLHPQISGVKKISDTCLRDVLANFPLVVSMLSPYIAPKSPKQQKTDPNALRKEMGGRITSDFELLTLRQSMALFGWI